MSAKARQPGERHVVPNDSGVEGGQRVGRPADVSAHTAAVDRHPDHVRPGTVCRVVFVPGSRPDEVDGCVCIEAAGPPGVLRTVQLATKVALGNLSGRAVGQGCLSDLSENYWHFVRKAVNCVK